MTGYPWTTGDPLLADDLNTAFLPITGGNVTGRVQFMDGTDWFYGWPALTSWLYVVTPNGMTGITGASDTLHGVGVEGALAIGVAGWGYNNHPGPFNAWGGYFEARQYPDADAYTMGVEIDITNMSGVDAVAGGPYLNFPQPTSIGLNLQSGGQISSSGDVAKHATVGIWLGDNDARFQTGMIFKHTGLVGTDGAGTGTATAIAFAQGHTVQWFQPNNVPGSRIFSQQTANSPLDLVFGNGLAYLQDSNGSLPLLGVQGGRPAAGNTAMLVLVGGASGSVSYAPVSVGAPDSAGSGYRTLRVAN